MQITKRNIYSKSGITLMALVITIITLILLAGISLHLLLNSGIVSKSLEAREETRKQTATEKINLKITNSQIKSYANKQEMPTLQEIADDLCEDEEIQYVTIESKIASLSKISVGSSTSIFTKLKDFPYEFEINRSLQLASIDGDIVSGNQVTSSETSYKVIFDAVANAKGTYSLTDSIDNFDFIEVYAKSYDPNGTKICWKQSQRIMVEDIDYETDTPYAYRVGFYQKDTANFGIAFHFPSNTSFYLLQIDQAYCTNSEIYKIVGYKYNQLP